MGYFRIFYYIAYIFNTISRLIRRNKKMFFIIAVVLVVVFVFLSPSSHAIYLGEYEYGDPNYAMYSHYESVVIDLVRKLQNVSDNNTNKQEILSRLKNGALSYYVYYGDFNNISNDLGGTENLNGEYLNKNNLVLVIYANNPNLITQTSYPYDNYCGIDYIQCKTYTFRPSSVTMIYTFNGNQPPLKFWEQQDLPTFKISMPSELFMYRSEYLDKYLYDNASAEILEELKQTNEDIAKITSETPSEETIENTENAITNNASIFENEYTEQFKTYDNNFLTTITDLINYNSGSNSYVDFTLPFVNYTYRLHSNTIRNWLFLTSGGDTIYNFIQLLWWFSFSVPIYILLRRIILWLASGEFINKPSKFALYMSDFISKQITPGMM